MTWLKQPLKEKETKIPPCQAACPIHQDVRGYIAATAKRDFDKAIEIIQETNPLPLICATICPHPCENECRRRNADEAISIRSLKRAAIEYGNRHPYGALSSQEEMVAVIGSGPGGLTAAHDLACFGYKVTVMEKESLIGGALAHFIPLYRLPRELLKRDIDAIKTLGVTFKTDCALGREITLPDLKSQGYRAVILSTGLPISRTLSLPGFDMKNVWPALPFLRDVNLKGKRIEQGKSVIVIGGGNVAIDVARSALRAGAEKVKVVCLESDEEMPAFPWEIQEAGEEGVEIHCSLGPKCVLNNEGMVCALETIAVASVFDDQGRFNPIFCEDKTSVFEGDIIIVAIGQTKDLSFLRDTEVELTNRGEIIYDPMTLAASGDGIFACGEVINGPGMAVEAMASGRRAALSAHHYLQGVYFPNLAEPQALDELEKSVISIIKRQDRQPVPLVEAEKRKKNFDYIELGYTQDMAICEARRCLSCGAGAIRVDDKCIDCLTCVRVCPYSVPIVTPPPENAVKIRDDQCQACGICVMECPAKAINFNSTVFEDMDRELEKAIVQVTSRENSPCIVLFHCYYEVDEAPGLSTFLHTELPASAALVKIPCVAKLGVSTFLKAFEMGAQGVFILDCTHDDCIYAQAALWLERRIGSTRQILKDLGMKEEQIKIVKVTEEGVQDLRETIDAFSQETENEKVKS